MATSGSTNFSRNRDELIKGAFRQLGVIGRGETPQAEDITTAAEALNLLIKAWQTNQIGLWLRQEVVIFLVQDQKSYSLGPAGDNAAVASDFVETTLSAAGAALDTTLTLTSSSGMTAGDYIGVLLDDDTLQWTTISTIPGTTSVTIPATGLTGAAASGNAVYTYTNKISRPLEIIECRIRVGSNDIPIEIISNEEYTSLATKTTTGITNQVYYDPQITSGKLKIWPVSDDDENILFATVRRPVEDFDILTDDADFPVEWLRALKFNLALEMSAEYKCSDNRLARIATLATTSLDDAQGFDIENTSVYFGYGGNR